MIVGVGMFTQAEKSAVPWEIAEYSVRPREKRQRRQQLITVYTDGRWKALPWKEEIEEAGVAEDAPMKETRSCPGYRSHLRGGGQGQSSPPPWKRNTRCSGARKSTAAEDLALPLSESCQDVATWKEGDKE